MGRRGGAWWGVAVVLACVVPSLAADVNPPLTTGALVIADRVHLTVEIARTPEEQMRGLSNRPRLESGRGMVFVYQHPQSVSIWMKDMRFPLDIIWIREGRIVKIEKRAPPLVPGGPERIYTATADLVLEVPAGFADREHVRLGHTVEAKLP